MPELVSLRQKLERLARLTLTHGGKYRQQYKQTRNRYLQLTGWLGRPESEWPADVREICS